MIYYFQNQVIWGPERRSQFYYDFYLAQRRKDAKNQRKEWLFHPLIAATPFILCCVASLWLVCGCEWLIENQEIPDF